MKFWRANIFILVVSVAALLLPNAANAQCAMCGEIAANSVKNGNKQGLGLNNGILYLLAAPYLAIAGVGYVWYKKYRRKNVTVHMKDEKLNLN